MRSNALKCLLSSLLKYGFAFKSRASERLMGDVKISNFPESGGLKPICELFPDVFSRLQQRL